MKVWITEKGSRVTRVLLGRSNVYLVQSGNLNIMVDTSTKSNWKKLIRRLKSLKVERLDYLVLTHSHYDHAANALKIKAAFGATVIIHSSEADVLSAGDNILPNGTNFITRRLINKYTRKFVRIFGYDPCWPDITFETILQPGWPDADIKLIHTPGHTRGSICIVVDDEVAIVGDTMFGVFRFSVFPPFANDTEQMIKSWQLLLDTNCRIFLPSHGLSDSRALLEKTYNKKSSKHPAFLSEN